MKIIEHKRVFACLTAQKKHVFKKVVVWTFFCFLSPLFGLLLDGSLHSTIASQPADQNMVSDFKEKKIPQSRFQIKQDKFFTVKITVSSSEEASKLRRISIKCIRDRGA